MASIKIEFNDAQLQTAFKQLIAAGTDIDPLLFEIGGQLQISLEQNFDGQHDPDGRPWEPISAAWRARKAKLGGKPGILDFKSVLRDSFTMQVGNNELMLGTINEYARVHQLGGGRKNMKARPFLGVSEEDKDFIGEAAADYLRDSIKP